MAGKLPLLHMLSENNPPRPELDVMNGVCAGRSAPGMGWIGAG